MKNIASRIILILLLFFALVSNGCVVAKISGKGSVPIILNQPSTQVQVVKQIKVSKMITFDYTSSFDTHEILSEVFTDGSFDAIINIVITIKTDPQTFFVNLFTLGLANARTVEITGEAVKLPKGLSINSTIESLNANFLHVQNVSSAKMIIKTVDDQGNISFGTAPNF